VYARSIGRRSAPGFAALTVSTSVVICWLGCAVDGARARICRSSVYPRVIEELIPAARHVTEQYATNSVGADHGLLKPAYPLGFIINIAILARWRPVSRRPRRRYASNTHVVGE
jgi:hypothetical protein